MSKRTLFVFGFLVCLASSAGLTVVIWKGAWAPSTEPLRLDFLGKGLLASLGMAALFGGGILLNPKEGSSIDVKAGPFEAHLGGGGEKDGRDNAQ